MTADPYEPEESDIEEEDIPAIDEGMLAHEVDFEEGMNPFPLLCIILGVLCLAAFLCQLAGGVLTDLDKLVSMGALSAQHVFQGEVWRMVSAARRSVSRSSESRILMLSKRSLSSFCTASSRRLRARFAARV